MIRDSKRLEYVSCRFITVVPSCAAIFPGTCIEKIGNYATLRSNGRYLFTSLSYLREKGLRGRTEEEEEEEKGEEEGSRGVESGGERKDWRGGRVGRRRARGRVYLYSGYRS